MPGNRAPDLVYLKSEAGQQAFKDRSAFSSTGQRSAFLLFDGKRTLAEVLQMTIGLHVTPVDVQALIDKGFLRLRVTDVVPPPSSEGVAHLPSEDTAACYQRAYPIATRLTASLGLRGFKLNLAIEAASGYDDLVALFPKLSAALGPEAVGELRAALGLAHR
jgi:hypothetical protein